MTSSSFTPTDCDARRIVVVHDQTRMDVSVPAHTPVGSVVGRIADLVTNQHRSVGEQSVKIHHVPQIWQLTHSTGEVINGSLSPVEAGITNGTILWLRASQLPSPGPLFDDISAALAHKETSPLRPWKAHHARVLTLFVAVVSVLCCHGFLLTAHTSLLTFLCPVVVAICSGAFIIWGTLRSSHDTTMIAAAHLITLSSLLTAIFLISRHITPETSVLMCACSAVIYALVSRFTVMTQLSRADISAQPALFHVLTAIMFTLAIGLLVVAGHVGSVLLVHSPLLGTATHLVHPFAHLWFSGMLLIAGTVLLCSAPWLALKISRFPTQHVPASSDDLAVSNSEWLLGPTQAALSEQSFLKLEEKPVYSAATVRFLGHHAHSNLTGFTLAALAAMASACLLLVTSQHSGTDLAVTPFDHNPLFSTLTALSCTIILLFRSHIHTDVPLVAGYILAAIACFIATSFAVVNGVPAGMQWPLITMLLLSGVVLVAVFSHSVFSRLTPTAQRSIEIIEACVMAALIPITLCAMGIVYLVATR